MLQEANVNSQILMISPSNGNIQELYFNDKGDMFIMYNKTKVGYINDIDYTHKLIFFYQQNNTYENDSKKITNYKNEQLITFAYGKNWIIRYSDTTIKQSNVETSFYCPKYTSQSYLHLESKNTPQELQPLKDVGFYKNYIDVRYEMYVTYYLN